MIDPKKKRLETASDRKALRRRISQFYNGFNRCNWEKCFLLVDPMLRENLKVKIQSYADGLQAFRTGYGSIKLWHVRISLHLDAASNKHDQRPFAFVYVVWQDNANQFHMFRERWVKVEDQWFTRLAGLVPNRRVRPRIEDGWIGMKRRTDSKSIRFTGSKAIDRRVHMEILTQILEEAIDSEVDSIQLEWVREGLEITYMKGNSGIGGVMSDRKLASALLGYIIEKARPGTKSRGKMTVVVHGKKVPIQVRRYDSFGEQAFELLIGKPKK